MRKYRCPSCKTESITFGAKYRAGFWRVIQCPHCGKRLTALPVLLALLNMLYVWVVLWFGVLAYLQHDATYLVYLVIGWLILDAINVSFIPLAALAPREGEAGPRRD